MRRMTLLVTALALVLGLAQCKKEQMPTDNPTGISITLDVDGGNNGNSKVEVDPTGHTNPNYATVAFEDDDVIYVGYNGAYVGTLTYGGEEGHKKFSGSVDIESYDGQKPLHFYFLGGVEFNPIIDETNNTATVNITDQTTKYPVISYAHSREFFTGGGRYTAKLQNKVSIMKFNVTTPSTAPICITGMNNTVTLNFDPTTTDTDEGFSYSKTGAGVIKMAGGSGSPAEKWAIVLPQASVPMGGAYTEDNAYVGTRPAIDEIGSNQYLSGGVNMSVNTETPLTLEALTDGTIVVPNPKRGMQYSKNGGAKTTMSSNTTIDVVAGDRVQFYGDGTNISCYNGTQIAGGTAQVKAYGNIMSLIDETGYATLTTLPNQIDVFCRLFYQNTTLTDASVLLLPATTLVPYCYYGMFQDCTSLTTAPALPATSLAYDCYYGMFNGCTSLTTPPDLPATTLANRCYYGMFYGCTSLTTAPVLPAETLTDHCYDCMFNGCTSLTTAPALPATTLAEFCYESMFSDCTGLTAAPALPATTLASGCYEEMFRSCTSLTTAPTLPATTLVNRCYDGMFNGCTSLTTAPALPANTLASYCYTSMFMRCTSLTTAPALPATTLAEYCYESMFCGCTGLTAAPALPATTLVNGCYGEMFRNCTSLSTAPVLPAETLAVWCYNSMFYGCINLSSVTCLATNISASGCTTDWLEDVAATGTFTKASGVSWPTGASGIPTNWTVNEQ